MTFYETVPHIHNIADVTDFSKYRDVPSDYWIALTDVQGSTQAIQDGRQKDVNAVAAASITSILNIAKETDLPFVFGGDGATLIIPPHLKDQTKGALSAARQLAAEQFDLHLRVAMMPVAAVYEDGYQIRVVRLLVSDSFQQAIFTGGGLSYAEDILKDPACNASYQISDDEPPIGDFSGFECRWNRVPSSSEETISLLVTATAPDKSNAVYQAVIEQIDRIYGSSSKRHPITIKNLSLALNPLKLDVEARVRHRTRSLRRLLKMWRGSVKAWIAMRFGIGQWGTYKSHFIGATDHEKFDDTLRMTISGTAAQRQALRDFLEKEHQKENLIFGIHTAQHALVTCIIFDYFGRQIHFVDGAEGGYAFAAKELKAQMKAKMVNEA